MTKWHMCLTCCVTKATDTHREYVIPIAFPLQQWLHKRASILRHTGFSPSCSRISWHRRWRHCTFDNSAIAGPKTRRRNSNSVADPIIFARQHTSIDVRLGDGIGSAVLCVLYRAVLQWPGCTCPAVPGRHQHEGFHPEGALLPQHIEGRAAVHT